MVRLNQRFSVTDNSNEFIILGFQVLYVLILMFDPNYIDTVTLDKKSFSLFSKDL